MRLLNVDNIDVSYSGVKAVRGTSFHVDKGEIVSLIGSNGAGKSTILKSISGLVKPDSGTISLEGKEIQTIAPHVRTTLGIAHVPEGRRIFPKLTVKENLLMGGFTIRSKQVLNERLELVYHYFPKLQTRLEQKGGTMSGGEQQMLAIGRALMMNPKLLMLDEPSMGLAPIIVEQIFQIIRNLNKEGTTIFLVEQNAFQALQVAHRGYVLQTGELILSGTGAELLKNEQVREAYLA